MFVSPKASASSSTSAALLSEISGTSTRTMNNSAGDQPVAGPSTVEYDAPPPYSEDSPRPTTVLNASGSSHTSNTLVASHLSRFRSALTAARSEQIVATHEQDGEALQMLLPHIEDILEAIASMRDPPARTEAVLIPGDAVDADWQLTDKDDAVTREMWRLIRVERQSKGTDTKSPRDRKRVPEEKTKTSSGFDEWGRWDDSDHAQSSHADSALLWWSDEEMAHRLAQQLQPDDLPTPIGRPSQIAHHAARAKTAKEKATLASRLGLSRKKPQAAGPATNGPASGSSPRLENRGGAGMAVTAEEVTFRKENEMGLWESKTGWGIVVRVTV